MGKDAFIATNFVLVPITSLFQGPMSQGPRPQCPGSLGPWVSVLRVPDPRSLVPGPRSQVLILDYAVFETSERRHGKDIFFEICSRRLKDVTKK